MSNERNYIYLEKIMKRVPIHAVAGTYIWKIGDASYKIDAAIERILVYELYTGRANNNFFELARVNLPKKYLQIQALHLSVLRSSRNTRVLI